MKYVNKIVTWLKDYATKSNMKGFVVGVSGGIDSAVTSTLCAMTGFPVICVNMPLHQDEVLNSRSELQIRWLKDNYSNISEKVVDLSEVYDKLFEVVSSDELGKANTQARLRMITLYAISSEYNHLVVGTGNKVEDFGVGFFTKYGDGGVDISPIADLMKSEVYEIARILKIPTEIQEAAPTDGLWNDGRTDEIQLKAAYNELEWAMNYDGSSDLSDREKEVLNIYNEHHQKNLHKMLPIPVCEVK